MPGTDPARRLVHVITGLETGGTQHSLLRLLSPLAEQGWGSHVISLRPSGPVGPKIERAGTGVSCLDVRSVWSGGRGLLALNRKLGALDPLLVQGWMYHGNLAASISAGRFAQLWSIRNSLHERPDKLTTRLVIWLGARLSRHPSYIVYNSATCARQHEALGYRAAKTVIIANGFDLSSWWPRPREGLQLRQTLEIPIQAPVVGMVARHHPVKNHAGFFELATRLRSSHPNVHFLCAGEGVSRSNEILTAQLRTLGLDGRCRLMGEQDDLRPLFAAMDVKVLPSLSEAFPNIVGEAMACEVPCVVTDVGECRALVGDSGLVVEAGDVDALTRATSTVLSMDPAVRREWGRAARARIRSFYSVEREIESYLELYARVLAG